MITAEAKVIRLAGSCTAHAGDPGLAKTLFGAKGRMGIITAVEVPRSVAWSLPPREHGDTLVPAASAHDAGIKRADVTRLFDPAGLFAW
jgi:hypothetical protein